MVVGCARWLDMIDGWMLWWLDVIGGWLLWWLNVIDGGM
jgi:hypothetical protein